MSNLAKPTIHLNGSNPDTLKAGYLEAYTASQDLLKALAEIELNARDYYPQADLAAFETAREQSAARYKAVKDIAQDMLEIIDSIESQAVAQILKRETRQ